MAQLDKNSKDYFILKALVEELKEIDNEKIRESFEKGSLTYLDDDLNDLRVVMDIIRDLNEKAAKLAPNNLRNEIKEMDSKGIKKRLKELEVLLVGRSGQRLNNQLLHKYIPQ